MPIPKPATAAPKSKAAAKESSNGGKCPQLPIVCFLLLVVVIFIFFIFSNSFNWHHKKHQFA